MHDYLAIERDDSAGISLEFWSRKSALNTSQEIIIINK